MAEYVRICPRCRRANPEYESLCSACGQFIALESAVPAQAAAPEPPAPPSPLPPPDPEPKAAADNAPPEAQPTRRYVPPAELFYLQLPETDLLLTVHPGDVLGQAHASSDAQLQVPATVAGVGFLHRRHCRFERDAAGWQVVAIDQQALGSAFTNPTFVNQHRLGPGERHPLADGDRLRLSGLGLAVRMV
jgi:FHA domain